MNMQNHSTSLSRAARALVVGFAFAAGLGACQQDGAITVSEVDRPETEAKADAMPKAQPIDMGELQAGAAPSAGQLKSPYGGDEEPVPSGSSGGGSFGLDPSQAMKLKPLDELGDEAKREGVISFSRLSLAGTDIEALLDHIFEEVAPPYTYPKEVADLDGKDVKLVGYMIPLTWEEREVTEFMLVRDLASCCFGGIPRPDEWAFIAMAEGKTCEYFPYVPVVVSGPFKVFPLDAKAKTESGTDENAPATGPEDPLDVEAVFSIVATDVERY